MVVSDKKQIEKKNIINTRARFELGTSRMLSERSTIWAKTPRDYMSFREWGLSNFTLPNSSYVAITIYTTNDKLCQQ